MLRSFLAEELIDELYLTLCPRVFGSASAPTLTGAPGDFLPKGIPWQLLKMETIGDECFLKYRATRSLKNQGASV